jgi:hypothetical protein
MVTAAVDEALAPLRARLDDIEQSMLETIVRLSSSTPAPPVSPRSETQPPGAATQPPTRTAPPPLPKDGAAT